MQRSISVGILVVTFVNMFPVKKLLTDDKKKRLHNDHYRADSHIIFCHNHMSEMNFWCTEINQDYQKPVSHILNIVKPPTISPYNEQT